MGMIYKPKWRDKTGAVHEGEVFWIKYYQNGKPHRESAKTAKEEDARKLLKLREGEIAKGKVPGIYFDKVTFEELAEDLKRDYILNKRKSYIRVEESLAHLGSVFAGYKVPRITSDKVQAYIQMRFSGGAQNSTINRELAALKRMLSLGAIQTPPKVDRVPYIPTLHEDNVRTDFLEHEEYLALMGKLPEYLKPVVSFAYTYPWRCGEILGLEWKNVDLKNRTIRLEPGTTKNDKGRTIFLNDEMLTMFKRLFKERRLDTERVFLGKKGKPIKNFRKAWISACIEAGLYELERDEQGKPIIVKDRRGNEKVVKKHSRLFHGMRRTGVRNLVRSGVSETVAMKISGHRTRQVFDRYNITSERDLRDATQKLSAYIQEQKNPSTGKVSGKVIPFEQKEANASV